MKDKILKWFGEGSVGASSKAMALAAVGAPNDKSRPYDPDDFNRCLLLLESVPEIRGHMDKVASISSAWAALVARWDEVESTFLNEVGLNWCKAHRASKTYDLMQEIFANQQIHATGNNPGA